MHAPYILSADDLDDFSGILWEPSILAADDLLGACYRKAMTPKKLWTLLFSRWSDWSSQGRGEAFLLTVGAFFAYS